MSNATDTVVMGFEGLRSYQGGVAYDRAADRRRELAERYGADAAAVVDAISHELLINLDDALALCRDGSPEFRAACERDLQERRNRAAEARMEAARRVVNSDLLRQHEALARAVANAATSLQWRRNECSMPVERGITITAEQQAALDAEVTKAEQVLESAKARLAAWDAAPDAEKTATYERLMTSEVTVPAPTKKTNRKTKE